MWPSFWRSFDFHSLEGFKYLNDRLEEYQSEHTADRSFVETLRLIAEVVTYGDQHDPSIFEFFMEKQVMAQFLNILKTSNKSDVALQLLQTLSIMIQSLHSEHAIYYLFSNEYINNLITYPFDFRNEELVFYYISFLRTISGKLDKNTISLLVKTKHDVIVSFPLYSEAIKFVDHQDNMIRTAVRALTLSIYRVNDDSINKFITNPPMSGYLSDLVKSLKQKVFKLDTLAVHVTQVEDASEITKSLVSTIEEIEDDLYYLSDILCAGICSLTRLMTQILLHMLILTELLPALHLSDSNSSKISTLTSLYILSRLLQVVNNEELVNTIAAVSLCQPMLSATCFNLECNGHSLVGGLPSEKIEPVVESGSPLSNIIREAKDKESEHNDAQPLETMSMTIVPSEESVKDGKSNLSSVLLSIACRENYKLILASLSLLVFLLETRDLSNSPMDTLGILPHSIHHKKLSQVFDALIRLLCSRPPHVEAMWHAGWLFRNILPYLETKFSDYQLNGAYENACNSLFDEVNDSCCDLILETLWSEWKDCKKVLEVSAVQKDIRFIFLPDCQPLVPASNCSSFFVRERMRGAVKVFVLFHQIMNLILRGTLAEIPQLDFIQELPATSRANSAGLVNVAPSVGVEVNLSDALPCRIAFEEGKELHVYMLAVVKESYGWLLLAEDIHSKPHHGVVFAFAPLAGLRPKIYEGHPRWLHLQIRPDDMASLGKRNQVHDGRWTLAFSDEQTCTDAKYAILEQMTLQRSFVKCALERLLNADVGSHEV